MTTASHSPASRSAKAPDTSPPNHLTDPSTGLQKYSCVLCKERKIKCDRIHPCNACSKAGVACIFRAPEPPRRRKRRDSDADERKGEAEKRKVKKYEEMLRKAGVDIAEEDGMRTADLPITSMSSAVSTNLGPLSDRQTTEERQNRLPYTLGPPFAVLPSREDDDRSAYIPKGGSQFGPPTESKHGRLVVRGNKARYMESNLWKVVSAEASHDALQSSSDEAEDDDFRPRTRDSHAGDRDSGLIMGITEANERKVKHPDTATIFRLWQIFLDNCNPITHIIHAPTLQQEIISVVGSPDSMPKPLCAILCSIYAMAIGSINEEECQATFGETKEELFTRYTSLARQALVNAAFLRTSDINVLVGFILYIISLAVEGDFESRWELCGVAMRIAQRIGVHKDPESLGLDPFNCEMRRRIWNQLWVLDIRCAEFAGCKTSLPPDSENVKAPTNCSDSALFPGMKSLPQEQEGFTEMSFMLLRVRLGQFLRKLGDSRGISKGWDFVISPDVPLEEKQEAIRQCELSLGEITKHCDMEIPIQATTARMAGIVLSKLKWLAHHPRRGMQAKEEQLKYAIDLIEVEANTRLNPIVARFMWHAQNTLQFDSIFFILAELRKRFSGIQVERGWIVLGIVYQATPIVQIKSSKIFTALRHMTLAAWDAREAAIGPQRETPQFILDLRRMRNKKLRHAGIEPPVETQVKLAPAAQLSGSSGPLSIESGSPTVSNENAASPLYSTDMEEIDWQLWDQVFSQELDPQYGQWITSGYNPASAQ